METDGNHLVVSFYFCDKVRGVGEDSAPLTAFINLVVRKMRKKVFFSFLFFIFVIPRFGKPKLTI